MAKVLVIAEKPSVAGDLVRALSRRPGMSKFENKKEYFENDAYIVSSAIGHLVELGMPKAKWTFENLPIVPQEFELLPIEKTEGRLKLLIKLMKRRDVETIINACDAGREGELIFHYVRKISGVEKPVQRLWMQSMTLEAIQEAFEHMRDEEEMAPLEDAALCRSESDWLLGINGTRALTAYRSRNGGFARTPVGRVQTPTLALMVDREKQIQAFEPRTYFEVFGDFGVEAGLYRGRWFDEGFNRDAEDPHLRPERIWEKERAWAIAERCRGRVGRVEEKKKPSRQAPPLLYDLTSLQREASNRFGFSARRTLQIAQALYERHKACTYPRTDSRYLPEDYLATARRVLSEFRGSMGGAAESLGGHAARVLQEGWDKPSRRIFDNSKVSDHFAIIPTGQNPRGLDEAQAKIYDMVARRFVAVFFPAAEFELTQRITRIGDDAFRTDGKVLVSAGWLEVYGRTAAVASEEETDSLVPVREGEPAAVEEIEVKESQTKPPPRYTEATLLSGMETAGKLVEDEELRSAMSEKGLGTPATRAAIIEGLISDKYVNRENRELIPTQQGIRLVDTLGDMGVELLCSPEMTGMWEYRLKQMEHRQFDRESFMRDVRGLAGEVVRKAREHARNAGERTYDDLQVSCPSCGVSPLRQDDRTFRCGQPDCGFVLWKVIAGRELQPHEAKELLSTKLVGPLDGFRSRRGTSFSAALELQDDLKVAFVTTGAEAREDEEEALVDENYVCDYAPGGEPAGKIYEAQNAYVLDAALRGNEKHRKVRLPKTLCRYRIPREQAAKFFSEGRTGLIEEFISKKGRPFKAFLVMDPEGARFVNWEFPPRAAAKEGAGKKAAWKKSPAKKKRSAPARKAGKAAPKRRRKEADED